MKYFIENLNDNLIEINDESIPRIQKHNSATAMQTMIIFDEDNRKVAFVNLPENLKLKLEGVTK